MNRLRMLRSFTTILVVFLLGNAVIYFPSTLYLSYSDFSSAVISDGDDSATPCSDQFPIEEKEKEVRDVSEEFQNDLFLTDHSRESSFLLVSAFNISYCHTQDFIRHSASTPLYITQRTLLI